jgi:diadenylate cyclase
MVLERLGSLDGEHLYDSAVVAEALGLGELHEPAKARGVRALARVPRLPEPVRTALHKRYRTFQALLGVPTTEFEQVEGIGRSRAEQLRSYFDRLGEIGTALEIGDSAGG